MALTKDDKEFIKLSLTPIVQKLDTFEEINKKQDERLDKLEKDNHETEKVFINMDNWVETRGLTCPQRDRIKAVEKVQHDNKLTKKFIVKIFAWAGGSVGSVWGVVKLVQLIFFT